jgi:predicted phage terminase large subunit-like protein
VIQLTRETCGEYNFASQYLQTPVPLGGGFIKNNWLKHLEPHEFPESYDTVIQSWDTASKTTQLADYTVCTTCGSKSGKYYVLDVWRKRVDFPGLKLAFIELYQRYSPQTVLVEDKSSGIALIQDLTAHGIYCIKPVNPEGDKKMRLYNQSALFENGAVCLPQKASWLADYVHELTSFPTGKHNDQVDSTTQALAFLHKGFAASGIFEYYRLEYEKKKASGA